MSDVWRLWVDSGGTFTDCLAVDPAGRLRRAKVLSSGVLRARLEAVLGPRRLRLATPQRLPAGFLVGAVLRGLGRARGARIVAHRSGGEIELDEPLADKIDVGSDLELSTGEEAPVVAARLVTGSGADRELPPLAARLASTRGTNALLEGKGSRVAFFVTRGLADLLEIGNQQRPELFALEVVKPPTLYSTVVEVDERLRADGSVLEPLDLDRLTSVARRLVGDGITAAAVALMHAYRNPTHERLVAERLVVLGFHHVSLSSALSSRIKLLGRAQTAVVDAYLSGAISEYVERVQSGLAARSLHLLTSAGGLVRADAFHPKDSLLSGPAGGVLGAAAAGQRSGGDRLLAFDMGGTSTDVSRFDEGFEYRAETRVGPARLASNSVAVETVAAGGGSICSFDGRQLKVGPQSAGARPGPACYGAGGPLTLTDVNLLLGRIDPARFAFPVDVEVARAVAGRLQEEVVERGASLAAGGLETMLAGFLRIANEKMAAAVRRTSVRKGFRPSDYWLVAFGGAGPQHGCALAELLGIPRVLVPRDAALLSAVGLGAARIERLVERQVLAPIEEVEPRLPGLLAAIEEEARAALVAEGVTGAEAEVRFRRAHLRFLGQDATLEVEVSERPAAGSLMAAYTEHYRELFGYEPAGRQVEVERLRILVAAQGESGDGWREDPEPMTPAPGGGRRRLFAAGAWRQARVVERQALAARTEVVVGPSLVLEENSVTVVEPGWVASCDAVGALVLERQDKVAREAGDSNR